MTQVLADSRVQTGSIAELLSSLGDMCRSAILRQVKLAGRKHLVRAQSPPVLVRSLEQRVGSWLERLPISAFVDVSGQADIHIVGMMASVQANAHIILHDWKVS